MPLRILLLTPQFYGIEKKIKSILEESGYDVVWIENKTLLLDYHGTRSKFKFLRRIYFSLFSPQTRYIKTEFKKIANHKFDILFAINAHIINYKLFKIVKRINPNLVSILYLWDSSRMYNWAKEIKWFDKIFTFDSIDSVKYGINYKPNFYLKKNVSISRDTDLFFVGKYSGEREALIAKIINQPDLKEISYFIKLWPAYKVFLHSRLIYNVFKSLEINNGWINKYLKNFEAIEGIADTEYLISESLSYDDMQSRLLKSNVILDIPFGYQSGYTHRVIEALANGKKLLTTNRGIINEGFYNPDQIHILDSQSLQTESKWIRTKSTYPVSDDFNDLELSFWLKSILNAAIVKDKDQSQVSG